MTVFFIEDKRLSNRQKVRDAMTRYFFFKEELEKKSLPFKEKKGIIKNSSSEIIHI